MVALAKLGIDCHHIPLLFLLAVEPKDFGQRNSWKNHNLEMLQAGGGIWDTE